MMLTRVHPVAAPAWRVSTDDADARARIAELYPALAPGRVRINMITSIDGSASGHDGTSESLTSRTDRLILGAMRDAADVVLVGAQSVRAEGYRPPRSARLAIVTGSGRLDGHRLISGGGPRPSPADRATDTRPIVFCPASVADAVRSAWPEHSIDIVRLPAGDGRHPFRPIDIVDALLTHGLPRILCEGGPRLARQLLEAGLVDELCLTTAPRITGGTVQPFGSGLLDAQETELLHLLVDGDSALYARWRMINRRGAA